MTRLGRASRIFTLVGAITVLENRRCFKQGLIFVPARMVAELLECGRVNQPLNSRSNFLEAVDYDSIAFLRDPFRVETLLRQCVVITVDNDWQVELKSFADRAGARLADEEIRQRHVVLNIVGKSQNELGFSGLERIEVGREFLIVSANENQLHLSAALVEPFDDLDHDAGAMSTK